MRYRVLPEILAPAIAGFLVVIALVGGIALWGISAPLAGAIIASGSVEFEGKLRPVAHLFGGSVANVLVQEGDTVEAGQIVLRLDSTELTARADELRGRLQAAAAEEARLVAERSQMSAIEFTHPLLVGEQGEDAVDVMLQQRKLFQARAENLEVRRTILGKRRLQLESRKSGLERQLGGLTRQFELTQKEKDILQELVDKGLARQDRLFQLLRAEAEQDAMIGATTADIAQADEQLSEAALLVSNLDSEWLERVDTRLAVVQSDRMASENLYREIMHRLSQTTLRAPASGTVMNLKVSDVGGVLAPREPALEIAPDSDELIVRAAIRPRDIEEVAVGSSARIALLAFNMRELEKITGEVSYISADVIQTSPNSPAMFNVEIRFNAGEIDEVVSAHGESLVAGMPAEVFIETGSRTFAEYLVEPLRRSLDRAFKEL